MLRLPPTRIALDIRDIEYHELHGEERMQRLISNGLKNRIAFGRPFPQSSRRNTYSSPQEMDGSSNVQNDTKDQLEVNEQLLRDSVSFNLRNTVKDNSLNNTADFALTRGKEIDPTINRHDTLLSVDGHTEPAADLVSLDAGPDTSNGVFMPHNSPTTPTDIKGLFQNDIGTLTNSLGKLAVGPKDSSPIMPELEIQSRTIYDHESSSPDVEPALPSPFTQVPRSVPQRSDQIEAIHSNSSPGHRLYASPVVSAYPYSPRSPGLDRSGQSSNHQHLPFSHLPVDSLRFSSMGTDNESDLVHSSEEVDMHYGHTRPFSGVTSMSTRPTMLPTPMLRSPRTPRNRRSYDAMLDGASGWSRNIPRRNTFGRQHSTLPVYEDDLPPELQPQTPINLPRHGVPYSYSSYPMTAPYTRSSGLLLQPTTPTRVSDRQTAMTPQSTSVTRASLYSSEYDQENTAVYAERERRRQARAERRLALQQGGDMLDTTPPRGLDRSLA